jgi:hypothetical protein
MGMAQRREKALKTRQTLQIQVISEHCLQPASSSGRVFFTCSLRSYSLTGARRRKKPQLVATAMNTQTATITQSKIS